MKRLLTLILPLMLLSSCSNKSASSNNNDKPIDTSNGEILVAYFSVTNNTKKIANFAQEHLDCGIFEIVPSQAYTSEDIDYNSDCRANREQNDDSARPEIKYTISDITKYDTIVLGYPIWWGQAPKIIYTFMESYDFSNKTILPFCTSGSSPIGSSATILSEVASGATWLEGKRFSASASKDEVGEWLDKYIKEEKKMRLLIDDQELDVTWEENNSVKELKELLPLTINMHKYDDFEQTGNIGHTITSNDEQITAVPGDIVLYNSRAISVFYNNNSWSYTRLGHINLNKDELNTLLNKASIVFVLQGE